MSCEVHLVLDPIAPSFRVLPWRALGGGAIEVELPSGNASVLVTRATVGGETAELQVGGRSCELVARRNERTMQSEWMLPDGGYLLVNDSAFHYPTGRWFNRR